MYFSIGDRSFIPRKRSLFYSQKAIALLFPESDRSFIPRKRSLFYSQKAIAPLSQKGERRSLFYFPTGDRCFIFRQAIALFLTRRRSLFSSPEGDRYCIFR
ncbi:MAG: hypothetical protein F6J93_09245 [Oscillatoria sp. SIO1A7]|nr:hypothetical protein [Oscillatoria sp. SIO1A7]